MGEQQVSEVKSRIDLHTHTTYSDGLLSPEQLLERAQGLNVNVLSITDHDTIAAYQDPKTQATADRLGIKLVPGVEISTVDEQDRRIHILGLSIDTQSRKLTSWLDGLVTQRRVYAKAVTEKLQQAGWALLDSELEGKTVLSKAHIANAVISAPENSKRLQREFTETPSRGQFIEAMMNPGTPFYVSRERSPKPIDAVDVIHAAGGIAVLAHPVASVQEQAMTIDEISRCILENDFDGIEAIYYYYNKSRQDLKVNRVQQYLDLAQRLGVLVTGGSDFHGDTPLVGRFTDLGLVDERIVPTKRHLQAIERAASRYRAA